MMAPLFEKQSPFAISVDSKPATDMVFNHSAGDTVLRDRVLGDLSNFISKPNANSTNGSKRAPATTTNVAAVATHSTTNDRAAISHCTCYENVQRKNGPHSMDSENSPGLMDANRMAFLISLRQLWEHVRGFAANAGTTSNDHCIDLNLDLLLSMSPIGWCSRLVTVGNMNVWIIEMYEQFDAESAVDVDDARLEYFAKKVFPKIKDSVQVLIFCSTLRSLAFVAPWPETFPVSWLSHGSSEFFLVKCWRFTRKINRMRTYRHGHIWRNSRLRWPKKTEPSRLCGKTFNSSQLSYASDLRRRTRGCTGHHPLSIVRRSLTLRGDPSERIRPLEDDCDGEKLEESLCSYLEKTIGHETEIERQKERRCMGRDQHRVEITAQWSPTQSRRGYYDPEEVPKPKGVKAAEALVSVKVAQSKVNLVLEQLASSPFISDIETVRTQKNFSTSKFNQYDPKSKPDKILTTNT
ncbi:hypothetical protein RHSIM_Rhsim03G0091700 [Rhododendron simsii]|uniref:Uncharacterized protein n=1 Tax=Rhododendron simsii TaxID=118357 RepID=A0A834LTE8_RHOSS|nr:hypothetical protein RHSIM_Rhsim03G0091700 [Rhododendron simsii]